MGGSWQGLGDLTNLQAPIGTADLSDEKVRKARAKTLLSASLQQGRASTFTSGSRGDQAAAPIKTLLGQ